MGGMRGREYLLGKGGANLGCCGEGVIAVEVLDMRRTGRLGRRFRRMDFQQVVGRNVGIDGGILLGGKAL